MRQVPAYTTRFIGWLLRRDPHSLPGRQDSLVDFVIPAFLAVLVSSAGFAFLDRAVLEYEAAVCWRPDRCLDDLKALANIASDPLLRPWVVGRIIGDNAFVFVYSAFLGIFYASSTHAMESRRWRKALHSALIGLTLTLGVVDSSENFGLIDALFSQELSTRLAAVSVLSSIKWCLTSLCAATVCALTPWLWRAIKNRWRAPG